MPRKCYAANHRKERALLDRLADRRGGFHRLSHSKTPAGGTASASSGVDSFNDYYDVALKEARVARLAGPGLTLHRADVADPAALTAIAAATPEITHIIHLAAQAGVRYSMLNPLCLCPVQRDGPCGDAGGGAAAAEATHFVYASSSSVYGLGHDFPLTEDGEVNRPTSLYAATKRADELISHAYTHLYALPQPGCGSLRCTDRGGRPGHGVLRVCPGDHDR